MSRLHLFFALLAVGVGAGPRLALAQQPHALPEEEPYEILFQRRANRQTSVLKGYGAMLAEFSPRGSTRVRPFLSNGLELGVIVNRRLRLGAYSYFSAAPTVILKQSGLTPAQDPVAGYLQIGGTAAWLSRAERPVHVVLGARLGYGGTVLSYLESPGPGENLRSQTSTGLLATPFADLELNLRPWLRANLGAGYRWATGQNTSYFRPRRDFSGPVLQVGVQFGNFK